MGIENVVRVIKEIHPTRVVIVKMGNFYNEFGRDAYIMSYLLGYGIRVIEKNLNTCGFPKASLNKVMTALEENNISYMIINKSENYQVLEEYDCKGKNKYSEYYEKAHKYIAKKKKIDAIYDYLLKNIDNINIKDKINKVEEILYEVRKI